ncbi:hypothetical protein [Alicyclobacillus dauci]|uniref:Uncharacterized protein n=1 Tax=Alicyclobacillus dauci TaxID=1475485 RepID=A0ABY6Z6Y6_9BACL|nr:hypothetical protein [Alicyclobacillus dauci]WAH38641.1 hypothetical protein NZD86_09225 [Alicyclobacillus dauci]
MPTFFNGTLLYFSVALAACARLFTSKQLATHALLRDRTQPVMRAQQFLWSHPETFEKTKGAGDEPWLWRLTKEAKRRYGFDFKSISGDTQRRQHWLGIGDLWLALTYARGRPTEWIAEPRGQFDVMLEWQKKKAVVEYQRTAITTKQWAAKWERRRLWYKEQKFTDPIHVILIVTNGQTDKTIQAPKGTIVCRDVKDVPRALMRVR